MKRPRSPRLRGLPFNRLIPNILTVLALCAGLTAIRFALQEKWELAVLAIVIAGVFDTLDGRLARLLGGATKFGAELDSLSDFVSFGVAPAVLIYAWSLQHAKGIGWVLAMVFAVCSALRLARFNTKLGVSDMPRWAYNFFTGVPAPGGAGLVMLPMMLSFQFGAGFFDQPAINAVVMAAVAILMISRIPTYSFKQFKVPHRMVLPMLLLVGLMAALLITALWVTLNLVGIAYMISLPLSVRSYRKLEREAARLRERSAGQEKAAAQAADDKADRVFEDFAGTFGHGEVEGNMDDEEDEAGDDGEDDTDAAGGTGRDQTS
ncbi:MAG: CDP-diacylglycerol--serine O-phosphatidyltransferase [Alphaproteobacteria bacterium]